MQNGVTDMQNGMKISMKRVFWLLVVLFVMILGKLFKTVAYDRQMIASSSYNSRLGYDSGDFKRGTIYDVDGNVMAESVKDGDRYKRQYPYGRAAAHITGYTGSGAVGIEAAENFTLLGLNNEISQRAENILHGVEMQGNDVHLTVDMDIQQLAYELLGNNKGAAVVMNPTTGAIIAMASTPAYNPNTVNADWNELANDSSSPMLNRATQGLYPPGSTFKIVTALAAMRNMANIDDFTFDCEGEVEIGNSVIHCYNSRAHGRLNIDDAMAVSCNSTFATLGKTIGAAKLRETADNLNANSAITLEVPLSQSSVSLSRFSSDSELAETSIGQGKTVVTPLYMAMLISSVANDGQMMQPYMVSSITDSAGNTVSTTVPKVYDTVMTAQEADRLTEMLIQVINRGTGTAAQLKGYQAAGKTGTAENENENDHSWFVGFASTDNPQVAVAVILENVSGNERATPIGARLMQAVLDKQNAGKIDNNNYNYQAQPVTPEENKNDEINSDTEIIENTETPDDDYVIGSDNTDGSTDGTSNGNNNENGTDGTQNGSPGTNNGSSGENNTGGGTTETPTIGGSDNNTEGGNTAPGMYKDNEGHRLELVNK